jgi:hypothetical protein
MDSLLKRVADIFMLVEQKFPYPNFKKIRVYAQTLSDHTIENIYHRFQEITGDHDHVIQQLRTFELQMEMENTIPMNLQIEKEDVLLCETHFSHDEICKLLNYHNIHINVYVSPSKSVLQKKRVNDKVCLIINTCKHYSSIVNDLVDQINLYNTTIPKENIIIVSGQEDVNCEDFLDGIKYVKVTYSGLHLTSAIYIQEHISEYSNKYLIMLPDTIKFGPHFFTLILNQYERMKRDQLLSLPFINPALQPTMDMGILHANHFMRVQDYLKKIKTYDTSKDNLLRLKQQLIYDENLVLGLPATRCDKSTKITVSDPPSQFILNHCWEIESAVKNNIRTVYLKIIDLYKYQRNFDGPDSTLVMDL